MRLNNYLQLSLFNTLDDIIYNIDGFDITIPLYLKDKIKKECSDIIREYKQTKNCFFRGSNSTRLVHLEGDVFKGIPRKYRRPKDTNEELHHDIDDIFNKKFGWKPRSSGVFVSPSRHSITQYGNHYIFIPKNGFKIIYSTTILDLYSDHLESFIPLSDRLEDDSEHVFVNIKDNKDFFMGYIPDRYDPIQRGDKYIINTNDGQKIYIKKGNISATNIEDKYYDQLEKIVNKYTDKNVNVALNGKCECMIKCDYFYLIPLPMPSRHDGKKDFDISRLGF